VNLKDNFSTVSSGYAKFRPGYPAELFKDLSALCSNHENALDCGTGSGQFAAQLLPYFRNIYATDISINQLNHAQQHERIIYSVQSAERSDFGDEQFDLITVAQAVHWFSFDLFYKEVKRILRKDGVFAVAGYGLFSVNKEIDAVIHHFYKNITGPYWDAERSYLDEGYKTIPFPFSEIEVTEYNYRMKWNLEHVLGYLDTWSAVNHYKKANGTNPVDHIKGDLQNLWNQENQVSFQVFLRVGRMT
jgi:SAM-dependent methyltransferase